MTAKILHLAPMESGRCLVKGKPELNSDYLSRCAYAFAHALLWDGFKITLAQKRKCLKTLNAFFQNSPKPRLALFMLCERVQLETMRTRIPALGSDHILNPPMWFSETLAENGKHLQSWYQLVLQARRQAAGFRKNETLLCLQYLAYITNPTSRTFNKGRKRFLLIQAYITLDRYYRTVLLFNYQVG